MEGRFDRLVSGTLVLCALAITGSVLSREFGAPQRPVLPALDRPSLVEGWKDALAVGIEIGDRSAPVKVIEFADLECPFCARFHEDMAMVMEKFPKQVSLVFVHFPLANHRFALPAARAVECADARGRVAEMVSLLYQKQDSIGIKAWGAFAHEAGIADTLGFGRCAMNPAAVKRIDAGKSVGARLQVSSTPTVIVNGWRYGRPPDQVELEQIVRRVLQGGSPGDTIGK